MLRTGNKTPPQSSEKGRACILHSLSLAFPENLTQKLQNSLLKTNHSAQQTPRDQPKTRHFLLPHWSNWLGFQEENHILCTADTTNVSVPQNSELPGGSFSFRLFPIQSTSFGEFVQTCVPCRAFALSSFYTHVSAVSICEGQEWV